jgi:hypothetical protein
LQCDPCSNPRCFCAREAGWDDQKIHLERLNEVKITGLQPSDSHLSLVRCVIASAPALKRLTVELYIGKELDCSRIPCNRGHWAPCVRDQDQSSRRPYNKVYEWTPGMERASISREMVEYSVQGLGCVGVSKKKRFRFCRLSIYQ